MKLSRARLHTCLRLSTIDEVVSRRCKLRNHLTIIAGFARATTSLFFNVKRQTCLRDGKTFFEQNFALYVINK